MTDTTTTSPQPYPQPYPRPVHPAHDGWAIAAFVTAWFLPLLAIIFGHISNHRAKVEGREKDGLAIAALVLGYLFSALGLLIVITVMILLAKAATDTTAYATSAIQTVAPSGQYNIVGLPGQR